MEKLKWLVIRWLLPTGYHIKRASKWSADAKKKAAAKRKAKKQEPNPVRKEE